MKLVIQKGFISQRDGEKITIFDSENSQLLSFNKSATFIFDRLKRGVDTKTIISELTSKYDVSEIQALNDTNEFVDTLLSKGLAKKEISAK